MPPHISAQGAYSPAGREPICEDPEVMIDQADKAKVACGFTSGSGGPSNSVQGPARNRLRSSGRGGERGVSRSVDRATWLLSTVPSSPRVRHFTGAGSHPSMPPHGHGSSTNVLRGVRAWDTRQPPIREKSRENQKVSRSAIALDQRRLGCVRQGGQTLASRNSHLPDAVH